MTENTEPQIRVFVYNGQSFKDPGAEFTIDDVRAHLATHYPEVASAKIVETENEDGTITVEFVKQVGTKGRDCDDRDACYGHPENPHVIGSRPVELYLDGKDETTTTPRCPHCMGTVNASGYVKFPEMRQTIACPNCGEQIEISMLIVTIYMVRTARGT